MARPITVLASAFLFAVLGAVLGHWNMKAKLQHIGLGGAPDRDALISYGAMPLAGCALGLLLAVIVVKLFQQP